MSKKNTRVRPEEGKPVIDLGGQLDGGPGDTDPFSIPPVTDGPAAAAAPPPPAFTRSQIGGMYAVLGEMEAQAFCLLNRGVPLEFAREVFAYSSGELDELVDPTAAVLDKYSNEWVREHSAELSLLLVLASIHQRKFSAARIQAMARAHESRSAGEQPAHEVTQ